MTVEAPPPPPGPGVWAPFVAPPTDGVRRRRLVAAGIAAGIVLILCVGGLVGYGALAVFGERMLAEQSTATVSQYLTAIQDGDYGRAYSMLCQDERERVSLSQFRAERARSPFSAFTVGRPVVSSLPIEVPVTLQHGSAPASTTTILVSPNQETGRYEVCGGGD